MRQGDKDQEMHAFRVTDADFKLAVSPGDHLGESFEYFVGRGRVA